MINKGIEKQKAQFIHEVDLHKSDVEEEINQLKEKAERVLTTALIVGGALALTYFIAKRFTHSPSAKKTVKSKKKIRSIQEDQDFEDDQSETTGTRAGDLLGKVGESLINQATAMLLDIAKEKLIEFILTQQSKSADEHHSQSDK
jgi:hypothetical protein